MSKKVGEKIRQLRVLRGLSQENLAEEIGMSAGNFGKIERGDIDLSSTHLLQIAKVLKVSVGELFESPIASEKPNPYGYATKEELEELGKSLQTFIKKELEKFRESTATAKPRARKKKS